MSAQVVTGNALRSGICVWLAEDDRLTPDMAEAQVFTDKAEADAALKRTAARMLEVVGCYLVDVRVTPNGPEPTHFREEFRRRGPSPLARGRSAA